MKLVTVKNYRCFREEQKARLAPLTLLVGENSTGKTSFLAMVRALWQVAFESVVPDFQEPPYDLGTFGEIAYNRSSRNRAKFFEASFETFIRERRRRGSRRTESQTAKFLVTFESREGVPYPTSRKLTSGNRLLEVSESLTHAEVDDREASATLTWPVEDNELIPLQVMAFPRFLTDSSENGDGQTGKNYHDSLTRDDRHTLFQLAEEFGLGIVHRGGLQSPFAGAPVRSTPRRTYDPTRPFRDPSGEYVPTLLANLSRRAPEEWEHLKSALEEFGKGSGLFDEISIESLGRTEGSPFQLHVRKTAGKSRGTKRNLIDVGYGVSQALPILTELLRKEQPSMFLLQQPEVHLHPTAQAALGSLFCGIASWDRQILVETHSDYILDRVRMDVRDGKTNLKPADVSILYFEPVGPEVKIHSLALDEDGNVVNAPLSYRRFFMEETRRSIGI